MTTTALDLSTAVLFDSWGEYRDGRIVPLAGFPDFYFPGLVFEADHYYLVKATYDLTDPANSGDFHTMELIGLATPGDVPGDYHANTYEWRGADDEAGFTTESTYTVVIGPGIALWDRSISEGRTAPVFESSNQGALSALEFTDLGLSPPQPVYSIDGVTLPAGGSQAVSATAVTANSVTAGGLGSSVDDGLLPAEPHLWFKLTATATSQVWADATLSYTNTPGWPISGLEYVRAYSGPAVISSSAELTFIDSQTQLVLDVTEGTTYYFRVTQLLTGDPPAYIVFRVGDYAAGTDWIQGPDQTWVASPTPGSGTNGSAHPRVLPPVASGGFGTGFGPRHQATFQGSYLLSQAFGGPAPSDDPGCYDVLWRNARVGQAGAEFWSPDPLNPDISIHADWVDGPGTPVYRDDGRFLAGTAGELDDFVGVTWGVDKSLSPAQADYTTWAHCWRFEVTSITRDWITGPSAGATNPTDFPPGFTGSLVWEGSTSELVALSAAPDERTDVGNTSGSCLVYATVVPTQDEDGWGPAAYSTNNGMAGAAGEWAGGLDKPDSFPAKQDVQLTASGAWAGGSSPWVDLTPLLATALEREALDRAAFSFTGSYPGALRFVSIPEGLLSDSPPVGPDPDLDLASGRNRQTIALQVTMRPARHRWQGVPSQASVELAVDTGVITGALSPVRVRFFD